MAVCIVCIGPLSGLELCVDRVALDTHRAKEPCPHALQNATIAGGVGWLLGEPGPLLHRAPKTRPPDELAPDMLSTGPVGHHIAQVKRIDSPPLRTAT